MTTHSSIPMDQLKGSAKYNFELWFRSKRATPNLRYWMLRKEEYDETRLNVFIEWLGELNILVNYSVSGKNFTLVEYNEKPKRTIHQSYDQILTYLIHQYNIHINTLLTYNKFYVNISEIPLELKPEFDKYFDTNGQAILMIGSHQLSSINNDETHFVNSIKMPSQTMLDLFCDTKLRRRVLYKGEVYCVSIQEVDKGLRMEYINDEYKNLFNTYIYGDSIDELCVKWNRKLDF